MENMTYHFVNGIRKQVQERGEHPALMHKVNDEWQGISWQDFGHHIDALSRAFLHYGVDIQEKIGIFANNMPEWTIADYAAMQIRAVAVPIYSTNTAKQAAYIINNADIRILFVGNQEQYDEAIFAAHDCPTLTHIVAMKPLDLKNHELGIQWLDFVGNGFEEEQANLEERLAHKKMDDLFTLIYTSGTTGDPKGVMLDYANIAHQIKAHEEANLPALNYEEDISLSFLPLSHIFERAWQAYTLFHGVTNACLEDPHQVKGALQEIRPTLMCAVPRFYEKIYSAIMDKVQKSPLPRRAIFYWALKTGRNFYTRQRKGKKIRFGLAKQFQLADKMVLSKLRNLVGGRVKLMPCGGAKMDAGVANFFFSIGLNVNLGYGMTETTATVSCDLGGAYNSESIGTPMPNCEVKIGENNEILVKGGQVMRGYYKNPQATQETFTEDGFLKTGDAGHIDEHGHLFITDRIKELMKTSTGKYIAPQMLEGTIGKDKFVDQIAVIADAKKYVSALIVPCFESLEEHAKQFNIEYKDRVELLKHTEIIQLFEKRLEKLQKELPSFEQVKKFTLLPEAFSTKMNEITPTLKLKRKVILERYHKQIEEMYKTSK